ncbi:MAG TPA: translation elongation factor Ts [Candidatus Paceibacterota bacterium]|nr:translation elongation factor Ts [Candidatus Paceibacterota bacterium]
MAITTEQVKALRDATGVSVMQCRKALEEAGGDMEKALIILRKKGSEIADKKADREASDGLITMKSDAKRVLTVILNCETDFVAKNADFITLANTIANIAWKESTDVARTQAPALINDVVLKIGENIKLGSIEEVSGDVVGAYIHHTGKAAAVVVLKGGTPEVAKDIAMHVTAMKPRYLQASDINDADRAQVTEVVHAEVAASDKPEDVKAKILEGKLKSYFKEQTLLDQPFFKTPEKTIAQYAADHGATVEKFVMYTIGA